MSVYNRKFSLPLPWAILVVSVILLLLFGFFSVWLTDKSFFAKEGPFWLFMVGLVPGLLVALLQFVLSWAEFKQISKFNAMKIKAVLESRDLGEYYSDLLMTAQNRIDVQGVTANRFMRDFAEAASHREEKKRLISALQRGVKVRFLLPEKSFLDVSEHGNFDHTHQILTSLKVRFPTELEVRYFSSAAATSLVRVDDEIVVGPVFPNKPSQHTPAIHTLASSRFGETYIENFQSIWQSARTI